MKTIEVWRPRIAIPPLLKKGIDSFKSSWNAAKFGKFRNDYAADPVMVAGIQAIYTDGLCGWHDDQGILESQYSLLFVVRNDTGSYIESRDVPPVLDQPVGTMVLLDIWHEHRLWNAQGEESPEATYLALCVDLKKRLPKRDCEKLMRERIKSRLALHSASPSV